MIGEYECYRGYRDYSRGSVYYLLARDCQRNRTGISSSLVPLVKSSREGVSVHGWVLILFAVVLEDVHYTGVSKILIGNLIRHRNNQTIYLRLRSFSYS